MFRTPPPPIAHLFVRFVAIASEWRGERELHRDIKPDPRKYCAVISGQEAGVASKHRLNHNTMAIRECHSRIP